MSITVKFTVNGHEGAVTVESADMLSRAVDEVVKALSALPYQLPPRPVYGLEFKRAPLSEINFASYNSGGTEL